MSFRTDRRDVWTALSAAVARGFSACVVIPTNMDVRRDGTAVMGAGLALQAANRFPGLDALYGRHLAAREPVTIFRSDDARRALLLVPTKLHWADRASLELIEASAFAIAKAAAEFDFVLVPRIGAGLGKLSWQHQVRPILERALAAVADRIIFVEPAVAFASAEA